METNQISKNARKISLFSILLALCVGIQITPRPLGLEFTSLLTFCAGYLFGVAYGALFGAMVMFINGFLSPWGLAGLNLPFQMCGMAIIGVVGALYKTDSPENSCRWVNAECAILGAFLTNVYYFITNLGYAFYLADGLPSIEAVMVAQINGALFTLLYTISNTILFGVGAMPIIAAVQTVMNQHTAKCLEAEKLGFK